MSTTKSLVDALKKALKSHGKTYRDVAAALDLSEASVKRLFSERNFTLDRLEQICQEIDLDIPGLVRLAESASPTIRELTEEQEKELVSDIKLLLVAVLLVEGWTYDDIYQHYDFSEPEIIQRLTRLDRLKLIELQPNNRVRLLFANDFAWRKNGPIEQYFTRNIKGAFLRSRFNKKDEALIFVYGVLSEHSNAVLQRRLHQVASEFYELHREDLRLPLEQRLGSSMILAIRPWNFFSDLVRGDPAT
jgi:transcriptional regulator with XRE-family HTH domain